MNIAVIVVLYKTPPTEVERIGQEVANLGLKNHEIFWIDNSSNGHGFAQGVNEGIAQGLKKNADYFLICNPDISLAPLNGKKLFDAAEHFDIWGFAMEQSGKTYYKGIIDPWRLSGGLSTETPDARFCTSDYVTGSFMILSRKVVDTIGIFSEKYFMYYEDVDYCKRATLAGLKVGIDSSQSYIHYELSQTNKEKELMLASSRAKFFWNFSTTAQKMREIVRIPLTLFESRTLIRKSLFSSVFIKNFLSLNLSAFIGKALSFVLFLFLIRYLSLKDYGLYTLVWAHVAILSPLVDFGTTSYGMVYLPREKRDRAISLFSLRFVLSSIIFVFTIALACLFRYPPQTILAIFLVSSVIYYNMTSGMYYILTSIREEMVKTSLISIITNAVMIATLIASVLIFRKVTYVFWILCAFYLGYAFFYFFLLKGLIKNIKLVLDTKAWIGIIKKSYVFVLISLFAGIYFKTDVFILNLLKGPESVGIYSSGYKFFEAMILLASSYNTLSAPSFSKAVLNQKKHLKKKIMKHVFFLALVGAGVVVVTYALGFTFLPIILKGNYFRAIEVVRIVIWALPFILFNSVFLNLLYAVELSHLAVFLFVATSILNIILNFLFIPSFSYLASSYITVFSEIMNLVVLLVLVFVIYRKKIFYD